MALEELGSESSGETVEPKDKGKGKGKEGQGGRVEETASETETETGTETGSEEETEEEGESEGAQGDGKRSSEAREERGAEEFEAFVKLEKTPISIGGVRLVFFCSFSFSGGSRSSHY